MRVLMGLGDRLPVGRLLAVMPDGSRRLYEGSEPGPSVELHVHNDRMARRFLIGGSLGFCESYLDGDWDSPDIEALFVYFLLNGQALGRKLHGRPWFRMLQRLVHALRPNNRPGARRNIARHYDLGNAFYREWLDPTMTYSSALFEGRACDLGTAQTRKYTSMARRLALQPDERLLEVGCGWGGFAEHAGRLGARVTAITISREQWTFARERIARAGLNERVDVQLCDYRDVQGTYDKVASIEMFEAVGEAYWPTFFRSVRDNLRGGGIAALQVITINDSDFRRYRGGADYIQKYIFPGGMLPSPSVLRRGLETAGLRVREWAGFGGDYARTLREWNRRFQTAWPRIQGMGFDPRFKRMWEQYLHYCAAGFTVGTIDVVQVAAHRD